MPGRTHLRWPPRSDSILLGFSWARGRRPRLPGTRLTRMPIEVPISSGGFARMAGCAVSLAGAETQTTGIIRCNQPHALDLAARAGPRAERF